MENNPMKNKDGTILPNLHSEQIKEEFYKWFESRGLLAELRAYMRQLMVRALEENNQNGKKWQKKTSTSPKLQAINLLVVDYLFHEDYFYTVSVFASEAHILDSLPQYSRYVTQSVQQRRWDPDSLPRFSRQETEDILDTLHLPPSHHQMRQAADGYLASHDSLLACIVRTMVPLHTHRSDNVSLGEVEEEEEEQGTQDLSRCPASVDADCYQHQGCYHESSYQLWSHDMQQLLLMAGLKLAHIQRMQHKWAQTLEVERQRARREAEEEFGAREEELRRELEEQLLEERNQLQERQSRVEVREQSLASLADHLSTVNEDVSQRLSQLQLQSDQLDGREQQQDQERRRLQEKSEELQAREEKLDHILSNLNESNNKEHLPNGDLTTKDTLIQLAPASDCGVTVSTQTASVSAVASTQTLDEAVAASTQTVDTEDHQLQTSFDQPDPGLLAQLEETRRKISELQEENLELRAHILQQRHRIDELTNRAANLSSQLEESQIAVSVLSGRESAVVASAAVPSPPPPPPMIIAPTFGFRAPQRQGGGEESLFVPRPQQATHRPDGRRRPLRFAFSQQPSPSEESSPTEEVIQNARARIQQLEQESVSIQRNFQDFQTRLFTTDSLMFPPLRAPRSPDTFTRVRRSEGGSSFAPGRLHNLPPSFDNFSRLVQNRQEYEEYEESRGEFYDAVRIDSLPSTRRLFSQRNIRHFERWKQFKKKFHKRDGLDFNRRNFKALNSNTSSEDDDVHAHNFGRRQGEIQTRRNDNMMVNNQTLRTNDVLERDELQAELNRLNINKNTETGSGEKIAKLTGSQEEIISQPGAQIYTTGAEKVISSIRELDVASSSKMGIGIDLECSAKLIESVKVLLEAQSMKDSGATMSNGSLAVESLPRDSVNNSLVDVGRTESSIITVQPVKHKTENNCYNTTQTNRYQVDQNINIAPNLTDCTAPEPPTKSEFQGTNLENKNEQQPDNRKDSCGLDGNNEIISSTNFGSEEMASNFAATSSDLAEVESGDRATTSLTSGSDILRELNPSKTDSSSSSVISAGFGEDSKQSSDFWD